MESKRKRSIHDVPFQQKIMSSFLLILLLPMVLIVNYTHHRFVYGEQSRIEEQFDKDSALMFDEIEAKLSGMEQTVEKVSTNPTLSNYFTNFEQTAIDNVLFAHQYFSTFVDWLEGFSNLDVDLHFYTRNGSLFENKYISKISDQDATALQSWMLSNEAAGNRHWYTGKSWPQKRFPIAAETGQQLSVYSQMVPKNFFHPETVVVLTVSYAELFDGLQDINPNIQLQMRNTQGDILYTQCEDSTVPILHADGTADIGENSFLYRSLDLDPYGLKITSFYPRQLALNNARSVFWLFLISMIALIGFFVLITYFISRSLSRRLTIITNTMRDVGSSGLDVRVQIEGNDEVGQLAQDFNKMMDRICALNEITYRAEVLRRDATIKALESEIDPHFLFNALQTIGMMAEIKGDLDIADAITSLGAIVRYNLSHGSEMIPLSQEIEHVRTYCTLQNLILNNRLRLTVSIPEAFLEYQMPRMLLSPLVENCILHGFRNFTGECHIGISLQSDSRQLRLLVEDNGNGIDPDHMEKLKAYLDEAWNAPAAFDTSGNGIALKNVHQRIRLKYGAPYGLTLESQVGTGTRVSILLPLTGSGTDHQGEPL